MIIKLILSSTDAIKIYLNAIRFICYYYKSYITGGHDFYLIDIKMLSPRRDVILSIIQDIRNPLVIVILHIF